MTASAVVSSHTSPSLFLFAHTTTADNAHYVKLMIMGSQKALSVHER
jgi:hypothetical protein